MALSPTMLAKLNAQITNEMAASQTYLAMACQFADMGLMMMARHFRKQTEEERGHALKILDYILEAGGAVELSAIPQPAAKYASVRAAVEAALAHENRVTQQIHDLAAQADKDSDYATRSLLNWFIDEQVEEVASMSQLLAVARMAGENLLQLDAYVARLAQDD